MVEITVTNLDEMKNLMHASAYRELLRAQVE
jgi:hypothetical protein